jgi:AcrR family transcriptional regulator
MVYNKYAREVNEIKHQENKITTKMLKKLITNAIKKDGFQNLKMDDIAKHMDVSRATMYKYFSSKEEVIEGVVNVYVDYINELVLETSEDTELSFGSRFQQVFKQSIMLVESVTDALLKDLQVVYPDLYGRLKQAMTNREQQIIRFYQDGMSKDVFNRVNEKLILLQDDVMLRELISAKYLLYNQMSLKQVLYDYYIFKKTQLFKSEELLNGDDSMVHSIIDYIVQKFNHAL